MINGVKGSITNLARQTMSQQLFVEERIRSDGHSGIKQTRSYNHGTDSYFETTHISKAAASMHDHSNSQDILGMGEAVVVINGVEFRTRHNDYHIRRQSTTDRTFNAIEHIEYPEVPPEVKAQPTPEAQVEEMKEWFKAFKEQNYTVRDYRKYFRPLMCYMEGAWTLDKSIVEPFHSERHSLEADSWTELQQQIRYTSYTGGKHIKENFSYLPDSIISINETTGEPLYAQWNYRILCHPYSGDIPTEYFRLQDDLAYRQATRRTLSRVKGMRAARFKLSEYSMPQYTGFTLLDKIMAEIPGKDNIPPFLNEEPLEQTLYDSATTDDSKLNTGYYHRMYRSGTPDASGRLSTNRAFSDDHLFFAETTQPRIAPVEFRYCFNKYRCLDRSTRFTWAIPLEVVYMTPLLTWNPYNLSIWENYRIPSADGRRGSFDVDRALNGTSYIGNYYITPELLFRTYVSDEPDPADTAKGRVGVLDQDGVVRATMASGTRIVLPAIPGVGNVRLRYPIFPLHVEGSTMWKELQVVKIKLQEAGETMKSNLYHIEMFPTSITGDHTHEFYLSKVNYEAIMGGQIVSATTSLENGHTHELDLWLNPDTNLLEYYRCDGGGRCFDWHRKELTIKSTPDDNIF